MQATDARLGFPFSIFVSNNEIYFSDYYNHRIRKILRNGKIVTIAGTGQRNYDRDNILAEKSSLTFPNCVFVSSNNEVFISDKSNNRIRAILKNGNLVDVVGNGKFGFSGDGGSAREAKIANVGGIFVSNNEIFLTDSANHIRIRKVLKNGDIVTIAGNGQFGFWGNDIPAKEAILSNPRGIFVSNNEIYFSDTSNNRIRKIKQNGNIVTIAGTGIQGYNGENIPAIEANLDGPDSIFVSNNEVYFSESSGNRIRKILSNGNIITISGTGERGYSGDGGPAIKAKLNNPHGIFVSNNEVYIADSENNRIRKVLENGTIITIAGNGTSGFQGGSEFNIALYPHIGDAGTLFRKSGLALYKLFDIQINC